MPDFSALHRNTIKTYNSTGLTSSASGRALIHNTAFILTDAHRGRPPRIIADLGRNTFRSRVSPRPAHPLASTLQLYYPLRRGIFLVQSPGRFLWWLGKVAHRASIDNSSANSYIVRFLHDPARIKIDFLTSSYTTHRALSPDPGVFSVIRPGGWLAVAYAMLMAPAETPYPPSVSREIGANHGFNILCFCCVLVLLTSCGAFRVCQTLLSQLYSL